MLLKAPQVLLVHCLLLRKGERTGKRSHGTIKRVAKEIGFIESKMPYQASDIVSHLFKTDEAISDGCASVSVKIDANDLMVLSERGSKSYALAQKPLAH
jgi:hypothetical protein